MTAMGLCRFTFIRRCQYRDNLSGGTISPQGVVLVSPAFMCVILRPRVGRFLPRPLVICSGDGRVGLLCPDPRMFFCVGCAFTPVHLVE